MGTSRLDLEKENEQLKRAVAELTILNEVSVAASAAIGLEEISNLVLRKCIKHVGAAQGAILLLDEDNDALKPRTFLRVMDGDSSGIPFHIGAGIMGWLLKFRKPLLVSDLSNDPRFAHAPQHGSGIRNMLGVPLSVTGATIGALCLFNKTAAPDFTEEDSRMLSIVAAQSAPSIESARLHEQELLLRSLEVDLRVARQIQLSLLPREDPKDSRFDIAGVSLAAQAVGGDYYDFLTAGVDQLSLVVADVSGKGMPAALLMANLQACLRGQIAPARSVAEVVGRVNTMFTRSTTPGRFATLVFGQIDLSQGLFRYVNAGHQGPLIIRHSGDAEVAPVGDLVIGYERDITYVLRELELRPGDTMVLYTDGVTDAINEDEVMFGEENLVQLLVNSRGKSAREIIDQVLADVELFRGRALQADDITLVVVKSLGRG